MEIEANIVYGSFILMDLFKETGRGAACEEALLWWSVAMHYGDMHYPIAFGGELHYPVGFLWKSEAEMLGDQKPPEP